MRQDVKSLENETHAGATQPGRGGVIEAGHGDAAHQDRVGFGARIGHIETGDQVQQGRLAHARVAHDGDELSRMEAAGKVRQDGPGIGIGLRQMAQFEHGVNGYRKGRHAGERGAWELQRGADCLAGNV